MAYDEKEGKRGGEGATGKEHVLSWDSESQAAHVAIFGLMAAVRMQVAVAINIHGVFPADSVLWFCASSVNSGTSLVQTPLGPTQ